LRENGALGRISPVMTKTANVGLKTETPFPPRALTEITFGIRKIIQFARNYNIFSTKLVEINE